MTEKMRRLLTVAVTLGVALLLAAGSGCSDSSTAGGSRSLAGRKIKVVCTIGMITDIVKTVGGDRVEVEGLMGPGVDPHLYKASEGDVRKLAAADVIFYNGLNLEGKMGDLFVRMNAHRPTVAVTEEIDPKLLREPPEFAGHYDPHAWFDVTLWMNAVQRVEKALAKLDPDHAAGYRQRAAAYLEELKQLDAFVKSRIAEIPKERRVLVTAHDAFGYFGHRYDIEVVGLQGISTVSEAGVGDVKRIVDLVVSRKIKAIFVETSVPQRTIEAVIEAARARGHDVKIGGALFSDAMGDPAAPEGTYAGMIRHNVNTIVEALK
ncbi:MAG: zinc ABC transporter substrate-binding protein [Verrucomicrobia bacterium]|nr:zinc ABC transporter substrate-binding protein [Verrucomicrobiota bacterium]